MIRLIYEALVNKSHLESTLLVLAGDHGMNDAGNHGGSAAGETSPALVFLSPQFSRISDGFDCPIRLRDERLDYYKTVEQSDIAPTLAALLGFPVPLNNLGVLIPEFLSLWKFGWFSPTSQTCKTDDTQTIRSVWYGKTLNKY